MGISAFADGRTPEHTAQLISPYAGALRQLAAKSGDLKGYPLKTTFQFAMGGPRCGSVPAGGHGGESSGSVVGNAGSAAAPVADAPAPAASPSHPVVTDGLSTLAEMTIETIAINTDPIPEDQFEMPRAWKQSTVSTNELPAEPECPVKAL